MANNIIVSGTPHVRSKDSTQSIMRDVIIALLPATVMGIFYFGIKAAILVAISVIASVVFEYLYQKLMKKTITIADLSAAVTGLLLALNMPASAPFWMPIVGAFFAIVVAKQFFGGIGQNFINPALAARAFLLASYPTEMTAWVAPGADAVSTATPLALLKAGGYTATQSDIINALTGNIGGCIGETCAIALIIGFIYLLYRQIISWRIPVVFVGTVFVLTTLLGRPVDGQIVWMSGNGLYEILVGGVMLGAIFMATDYTTSPVTAKGQIIMAFGCGLLTSLIRIFGGYPEGVSYSILIMNLCVPLIDRFVKPTIFGALPKTKEAKKA